MLPDSVVAALRCPVCAGPLSRDTTGRTLRCPDRHSFDLARQGYANLLTGHRRPGTADTPAMVAARAGFLDAGHYAPVRSALADTAAALGTPGDGLVLDSGAGTGYYLAGVLDRLPGSAGVAVDVSTAAVRRAARAHPRAGAVVADVWAGLPLRDASVGVILDVFAPRNSAEFHRVLRPDGALLVATPTRVHLAQLVEDLGLLAVDERKPQRLTETLAGHFEIDTEDVVEFGLAAGPAEVEQLVLMGPSAHHVDPVLMSERIAGLTTPVGVQVSVSIARYRPRRR